MVTKQQQLEFAAVHIEKWKSGYDFAVIEKMNNGQLCVRWPSICSEGVSKKEWQQERDKMQKQPAKPAQDNSWYERGELPPVGTICKMIDDKNTWLECEIVAHKNSFCIGWISSRNAPFYTDDKSEFRPFHTERENVIKQMDEALRNRGSAISDVILGELYDAGFRMVKP